MFSARNIYQVILILISASLIPASNASVVTSEEVSAFDKPLSVLLLNALFPAHLFPLVSLGEELVKRGHNVTLCSPVMEGSKLLPNVPESVGIKFVSAGYDDISQEDYNMLMKSLQNWENGYSTFKRLADSGQLSAVKIRDKLESLGVGNFDVIVCDYSILQVGLYFAFLGKRVIIFSSFLPPYPAVEPPWPTPITLFGGQSDDLSFLQRLLNRILSVLLKTSLFNWFESIVERDEGFAEVLGGVKLMQYPGIYVPHIATSVVGFDVPTLLTPLVHYVGPVLKGTIPDLDKDIESWLRTKQNKSVIYISMGTTGYVSLDTAKAIVEGVKATGYDAIWALREDCKNVLEGLIDKEQFLIKNWVNQQAILKHPAITASIIHCGLNSVQESLYNALPVICLPHAFDQFQTGTTVGLLGVGMSMYSFMDTITGNKNLSAGDMTNAIDTVTSEHFKSNARKVSLWYKFAGGAKTAADLVEFYADVGYDHLIPAFAKYNWTWVQYYNADVYLVLIGLFVLFLYCTYKCVRCCCLCICTQNSKKGKAD